MLAKEIREKTNEELLQEIGNDFSDRNENESVSDYLQRLCCEAIR